VAKPRADAPDLLASPLPKGDTLLHRSGHRAGELRRIVAQGIISRGHGGIDACLQVSQVAQCTDDPPTDLLDHGGDVSGGRWLDLDKSRLETLGSVIEIDVL
jgi:hypothetical protein